MDFDFSDDQTQLRDAVATWVSRGYSFERRRGIEAAGGFARKAWDELAELGLTGLYVPENNGGLGLGAVEGMVVMEELGRGIVIEPLAQAFIAGAVLAAHADPDTQGHWLPRIASGQALVVLAYHERKARYRLNVCEATAAQTSSGWALSAIKSLVPAGDEADAFLVPAQIKGKIALFLVERAISGVETKGYGTQDGGRAAEVTLHSAAATLITTDGLLALEYAVDIGMASACAEAVGTMEKLMALTVEYLNTRKQFGVVIGSFQSLRHRAADMKMHLELARSMSYYAHLKLGAPAPERRQAIARAKYQLGQSMRYISQQAVQLHGGIGVTDEYIGSHYFRKLTQMEMQYGDSLHHLSEVSARMQDTAGVFG